MRISGCDSAQVRDTQRNSAVARASVRTANESSALKLTLQTAEGDTVEISLEAQNLRTSQRGWARGPGGSVSQRSDSQSSSFKAAVNVTGDLSDAEMQDIQEMLQSLSAGETPQAGRSQLDTISAYAYSYQHSREVSQTRVELYG